MKAMTDSYECVTDIQRGTKEICLSLGAVTRNRVISDNCTKAHTFDYFDGSELSYALSFAAIGVFGIACIITLKLLAENRNASEERLRKKNSRLKRMSLSEDITLGETYLLISTSLVFLSFLNSSGMGQQKGRPQNCSNPLQVIEEVYYR